MNRFLHVQMLTITLCFLLLIACGDCKKECAKQGTAAGSGDSSDQSPWNQNTGSGEVLATVNGIKIYMSEFKERMEKQSPYIQARYNTLEKRKEFIDSMIRFELLSQAAVDRGFHKDPEVVRAAKQVMTQTLMREEFENKVKREDITDEELRAYYDENQKDYNKPAMRRASHILVKVAENADKAAWSKAKKKAMNFYKEAKSEKKNPNSFRKLAGKHSEDTANKNRGGDLGYFAKTEDGGPMVKEFSDTAFAMEKINDISKPIRTKFGYHIVRLTGKRDKIERTFDQVKGQIQHRLFKERRTTMFDKFVKELNDKAKIDIDEKLLEAYQTPQDASKTEAGETPAVGKTPPGEKPAIKVKQAQDAKPAIDKKPAEKGKKGKKQKKKAGAH